ncbi:MAG: hypothetical protein U1E46_06955 [Hyphomicrobiales bacterium]
MLCSGFLRFVKMGTRSAVDSGNDPFTVRDRTVNAALASAGDRHRLHGLAISPEIDMNAGNLRGRRGEQNGKTGG